MLKLEPASAEPIWLDVLPGVRIQFRPVSVAAMLIARGAAGEALKAGGEQSTIEAGAAFTRGRAPTGAVGGGGDGGGKGYTVVPAPQTNGELKLWPAFDAIDRLYVGPALTRLDEKNV